MRQAHPLSLATLALLMASVSPPVLAQSPEPTRPAAPSPANGASVFSPSAPTLPLVHQQLPASGTIVAQPGDWRAANAAVAVGQMRQVDFIADEPGDWAFHCHKSHHTMGAMGHDVPTMIGVDHRGLVGKTQKIVPDYMLMGERGMGGWHVHQLQGAQGVGCQRLQGPRRGHSSQARVRQGPRSPLTGMLIMKTMQCIAACALLASASATFAHGNISHAIKEQKTWGIAGDAKDAKRTVTLNMTDDMRFTPEHFNVKKGETLRLRVMNQGQLMHEMVLGTKATLDEHAQMMLKYPGMEHAEPYMAHVAPGKIEDLVWSFNRAGSFEFACLIAGHYQAGMTGRFTVTE